MKCEECFYYRYGKCNYLIDVGMINGKYYPPNMGKIGEKCNKFIPKIKYEKS